MNNVINFLIEIALNLWVAFGNNDHFDLILLLHEHEGIENIFRCDKIFIVEIVHLFC